MRGHRRKTKRTNFPGEIPEECLLEMISFVRTPKTIFSLRRSCRTFQQLLDHSPLVSKSTNVDFTLSISRDNDYRKGYLKVNFVRKLCLFVEVYEKKSDARETVSAAGKIFFFVSFPNIEELSVISDLRKKTSGSLRYFNMPVSVRNLLFPRLSSLKIHLNNELVLRNFDFPKLDREKLEYLKLSDFLSNDAENGTYEVEDLLGISEFNNLRKLSINSEESSILVRDSSVLEKIFSEKLVELEIKLSYKQADLRLYDSFVRLSNLKFLSIKQFPESHTGDAGKAISTLKNLEILKLLSTPIFDIDYSSLRRLRKVKLRNGDLVKTKSMDFGTATTVMMIDFWRNPFDVLETEFIFRNCDYLTISRIEEEITDHRDYTIVPLELKLLGGEKITELFLNGRGIKIQNSEFFSNLFVVKKLFLADISQVHFDQIPGYNVDKLEFGKLSVLKHTMNRFSRVTTMKLNVTKDFVIEKGMVLDLPRLKKFKLKSTDSLVYIAGDLFKKCRRLEKFTSLGVFPEKGIFRKRFKSLKKIVLEFLSDNFPDELTPEYVKLAKKKNKKLRVYLDNELISMRD